MTRAAFVGATSRTWPIPLPSGIRDSARIHEKGKGQDDPQISLVRCPRSRLGILSSVWAGGAGVRSLRTGQARGRGEVRLLRGHPHRGSHLSAQGLRRPQGPEGRPDRHRHVPDLRHDQGAAGRPRQQLHRRLRGGCDRPSQERRRGTACGRRRSQRQPAAGGCHHARPPGSRRHDPRLPRQQDHHLDAEGRGPRGPEEAAQRRPGGLYDLRPRRRRRSTWEAGAS